MDDGFYLFQTVGFEDSRGTEIHDLETVKLRRITPWWSRNILISYNSL